MAVQNFPKDIVIRPMLPGDMSAVFEIEQLVFPNPFEHEKMEEMRRWFPRGCFVAVNDGSIIGFVMSLIRKSNIGHIISVAVSPGSRRRGIGSELINTAMGVLKDHQVTAVRLEVDTENRIAISMYKSMGFKIDQRIPEYYLDGSDAYVMFYQLVVPPE